MWGDMRARNKGVIYTGKVGAKLRPKKGPTTSRRKRKKSVYCLNGPFQGNSIWLDADAGLTTFVFQVRDSIGQYSRGIWKIAEPATRRNEC